MKKASKSLRNDGIFVLEIVKKMKEGARFLNPDMLNLVHALKSMKAAQQEASPVKELALKIAFYSGCIS